MNIVPNAEIRSVTANVANIAFQYFNIFVYPSMPEELESIHLFDIY